MKLSTTLVLLLLVGGLIAYISGYERHLPSTTERLARVNRPFEFAPAEAADISITTKDGTLKLQRKDDAWHARAPYQDRANPEWVAQLLKALNGLEWRETVARKDMGKEDYKRTGLGNPTALEVAVLAEGGKELARLRFGSKAPFEESFYAVQPGEKPDKKGNEVLHVTKSTLPALLSKNADDWRDIKLVRIPADTVRRFVLTAGTGAIEFTREKGKPWQLVKPLQTAASDERVNAVLAAVLNMDVHLNPAPKPSEKTPNPALPLMTVTLEAEGQPAPVVITLHPVDAGQEVPAEASNRPGHFLAPQKLGDFWRLQPNHLRDQQLARIPVETVTGVRLRSLAQPEVVLNRDGGAWALKRFGKLEPGNQERIQALLDGLNGTQVKAFVTDNATANLAPYGLDRPFLEIEWITKETSRVLQFGQGEQGVISAKYQNEPTIFQVSPLMLSISPPETLKWRSGRVITANLFAARRVVVAEGTSPALTLNYAAMNAGWSGTLAGQDITDRINSAAANQLLNRLVNFDAVEWSTNRTAAFEALKNPTLTVQLLLADLDKLDGEPRPLTLTFAPAASVPGQKPTLYHGRLNEDPDTFIVDRPTYEALTAPMLKVDGEQ
ncbi:DUF4340 domain-containing protein [Verrucomicrobium sp. BvORR106]|uniref:DUF4340 domain-containing protein n=1 Tax=Verrucomicrobium sp. BvORR106 TaxID=1403819 RepID=UPI00056EB905|nr:DUF4340 domain-containing protein [Verrucomicrobium sp. BvORR106]